MKAARNFICIFFAAGLAGALLWMVKGPDDERLYSFLSALIFAYGIFEAFRMPEKKAVTETLPPLPESSAFYLPDGEDDSVHSFSYKVRNENGRSVSVHYETDSCKVVIPFCVGMTLLFLIVSIVLLCFRVPFGIMFASMTIMILTLFWLSQPYSRWVAQYRREHQEKMIQQD